MARPGTPGPKSRRHCSYGPWVPALAPATPPLRPGHAKLLTRSPGRHAILLNAAFNLASASFESEVFRTRGLYCSISGRTLSSVTLLTSTKSADDPDGIVLASFLIKSSLMP